MSCVINTYTAPHVVDPKNPGAVDEIIHLGDFWDEEKMRENKEAVLKSNARVGRLFKIKNLLHPGHGF